ncbi:MAG: galactokinase [Kosmotogaceae bacterium]|nr:galactokinase [Kosmotogaceae bacterium]
MKRYFVAPGRVNVIGEHTDYNQGFVMPVAIDKYVLLSIELTDGSVIALSSIGRAPVSFREESIEKTGDWSDYLKGVFWVLKDKLGVDFGGMNVEIVSSIPEGAGLSSSAALEVALILALNSVFGLKLEDKELYSYAQQAENEFVGVQCGIMDQFAAVMGKKDKAIFLDTLELRHEYVPLELGEYTFVVFDSKVHHSLSSGNYNNRRAEANKALEILGKNSYREVSMVDLFPNRNKLGDLYYRRALHVVSENMRVLEAMKIMSNSNFENLGRILIQSHESLALDYEVTCEETDFIVDTLRELKGVSGARMIGAGFGGSVLALCEMIEEKKIVEVMKIRYKERFGIDLDSYEVRPSDGAREVDASFSL